jgi:hypothetical protein
VEAVCTAVSPEDLAETNATDAELNALLQGTTASRLEKSQVPGSDVALYCDTSTTRPRPYVPVALRRQVFDSLHGPGQLGTRATAKLISQLFVWPGVQKDCRTWARTCQSCQRSKISRHTTKPLGRLALPTSRFQDVHIVIVTSDIRRLQVLSDSSGSLHPLARSHSPPGHHGGDGGPSPAVRMDNALGVPAKHHHQPGPVIRITALPLPGQNVRHPPVPHDGFSSSCQRPRGADS